MDHTRLARNILIADLALVFMIFGIWKFVQPFLWIGWIPLWMEGFMGFSRDVWLSIIGATEIILAMLLILGTRSIKRVAALLIAIHLVAVISIAGFTDIGVRDMGLLVAAIALWLLL